MAGAAERSFAAAALPVPYYRDDAADITIYHGDCREIMPSLSAGSVHVGITSPPYNKGIRWEGSYQGPPSAGGKARRFRDGYGTFSDAMPRSEYCEWQRASLTDFWRLIGDDGAIFYNHKPRIVDGILWTPLSLNPDLPLRQIIQWNTGAGVNFMPTAFMPAHEWILMFARPSFRLASREKSGLTDVWTIPPAMSTQDHSCPFPIQLPTRIIGAAGARNVLDPFMGTGTTLVAAKTAGIPAIGIDLHERFCEIAAARLAQGALFRLDGAA
jgi:site-specific DNA-methyltransferase (adenine-specific)